jgi:uncharacterized integral membrane protein
MLRRLVRVVTLIPLAAVLVGFAVANRHAVMVSFDPFDAAARAHSIVVPLYLIAFSALIAGVLLGGAAAWIKQGKWRRARARLAAELRVIQAELAQMRQRAAALEGRALAPTAAAKRPPAA